MLFHLSPTPLAHKIEKCCSASCHTTIHRMHLVELHLEARAALFQLYGFGATRHLVRVVAGGETEEWVGQRVSQGAHTVTCSTVLLRTARLFCWPKSASGRSPLAPVPTGTR